MEKEARPKNKLMKFLPRATSALTFQNPHFSPGREAKPRTSDVYRNRVSAAQNRGFSGPLISLVPMEARGNKKGRERKGAGRESGGFDSDADEPRSPKVSCIGQIKQKKKLHKLKREKSKKLEEAKRLEAKPADGGAKKKPNLSLGKMLFGRKSKPDAAAVKAGKATAPPPGLSQMKRFSSGRDAFANFDWTKQVAPVDRECYSDDDEHRRDWGDDDDDEEDEEEGYGGGGGGGRLDVIIPFSAPMAIGGGSVDYIRDEVIRLEPRKEINLWKKRNMAPPTPLKLNSFR